MLDSRVFSHRGSLLLIRENMVQSYYISSGKQGRNSWQPTEVRDKLRYQLCITWLLLYNDYTWCHNEVEDRNYDERSWSCWGSRGILSPGRYSWTPVPTYKPSSWEVMLSPSCTCTSTSTGSSGDERPQVSSQLSVAMMTSSMMMNFSVFCKFMKYSRERSLALKFLMACNQYKILDRLNYWHLWSILAG